MIDSPYPPHLSAFTSIHVPASASSCLPAFLQTVGRRALTLLEAAGGAGMRSVWGDGHAGARAAGMGRDPASYEDFFYIYGGEALAEELEALANECSHACNRSRSKLEGGHAPLQGCLC